MGICLRYFVCPFLIPELNVNTKHHLYCLTVSSKIANLTFHLYACSVVLHVIVNRIWDVEIDNTTPGLKLQLAIFARWFEECPRNRIGILRRR